MNKRGQCQIYLNIAEREYLRRSQSTNKRGQCQIYLNIAEREYLRQSQRYEKSSAETSVSLIMPRRSIFGAAKDTHK